MSTRGGHGEGSHRAQAPSASRDGDWPEGVQGVDPEPRWVGDDPQHSQLFPEEVLGEGVGLGATDYGGRARGYRLWG